MSYPETVMRYFNRHASYDLACAVASWNRDPTEEEARRVVAQAKTALYPTSQTRYRLGAGSHQEELMRTIFDVAFRGAPQQIAEATGLPYPLWKRAVLIEAPRQIAKVINHPAFSYPAGIALGCFGMFRFYTVISGFITGSLVPFFAKNTPLAVTELFHKTVRLFNACYEKGFQILGIAWIVKRAILLCPEIPHLSPALRRIDLSGAFWALVNRPQSIFTFLTDPLIDVTNFLCDGFKNTGRLLQSIADQTERESYASCKEAAYRLWIQSQVRA